MFTIDLCDSLDCYGNFDATPPGGHRTETADELMYARQHFVTIVKAHGLQAIDLVSIDYKSKLSLVSTHCITFTSLTSDLTALKAQSEEGARMGFTG